MAQEGGEFWLPQNLGLQGPGQGTIGMPCLRVAHLLHSGSASAHPH